MKDLWGFKFSVKVTSLVFNKRDKMKRECVVMDSKILNHVNNVVKSCVNRMDLDVFIIQHREINWLLCAYILLLLSSYYLNLKNRTFRGNEILISML